MASLHDAPDRFTVSVDCPRSFELEDELLTDDEITLAEKPILISFVIPLKDEEDTLVELKERILEAVPDLYRAEIIFIDDGSSDASWKIVKEMAIEERGIIRGIRFRSNAGKASALTAGFRAARGEIVFTLDADLQDDPTEIPRFIAKLGEGYDIVSGWKKKRHDPWHKVLPSRVFNAMLSRVCGVNLHDHNCGFKCYRADVVRELTLHGEMHRMIPSLGAIKGFRSTELVVTHHPRRFGQSKYGFERYLRGFMDMLTVGFLRRFRERPGHFIGSVALSYILTGLLALTVGIFAGITQGLGLFFGLTGILLMAISGAMGVLAIISELVIRGGLTQQWQLPIVEDTVFNTPRRIETEVANQRQAIGRIPITYNTSR